MKVTQEYHVCDRCDEQINRHWIKQLRVTKLRRRLYLGQYVTKEELDLCDECIEEFENFMNNIPTARKTEPIMKEKVLA